MMSVTYLLYTPGFGGLGISKADEMAEVEYAASIKITGNSLKDSILRQEFYYKKDDAKEAEI